MPAMTSGLPAILWQPMLPPEQIAFVSVPLIVLAVWTYVRSARHTSLATSVSHAQDAVRLRSSASANAIGARRWFPVAWPQFGLLLMRLSAITAIGVILMGPSQLTTATSSQRPMSITYLLDLSESMETDDCHGLSRWQYARNVWMSPAALSQFGIDTYVDLNGFVEEVFSLRDLDPDNRDVPRSAGILSYIDRCTREAIQSQSLRRDGAIVLLSDGHDSEDAPPDAVATLARSRNIPIYAVALGGTTSQQDMAVTALPLEESFLPNEPGAILVKVRQAGLPQAKSVLRLRGGEREQSQVVDFQGREIVELQFEVRHSQQGQYEYQVLLDPVNDEQELRNNQQTVFCQVEERRIRILLLEGQPFWDTKFLAQSLRKDERIELTQITQVTDDNREAIVSRAEGRSAELPTAAEQWAQYDLVILGKDVERLLDEQAATLLRDFVVDQGGHLLLAREQPYRLDSAKGRSLQRILAPVEPVDWEASRTGAVDVQLRPGNVKGSWFAADKMGIDPQEVFAELPALHSMQRIIAAKPSTIVYAEAVSRDGAERGLPLLVSMRAGRGQVAAVLGQGTWQWSLLPPSNEAVVSFYDTFWSNLARWLVRGGDFQPGEQASLKLSRQSVRLDDELTIELDLKQATPVGQPPRLVWRTPDGTATELALQPLPGRSPRYRTRVRANEIGVHQIEAITPGLLPNQQVKRFNVYDVNVERLETSARPDYLRKLAEASGGQLLSAENPQSLVDLLNRRQLVRQVPSEPIPLWDRWTWLTLLLSWMGAEWLLRRMAGLW